MKNSLKALALSLLAVATLAGCFKVQVDLSLNENDTIDGSMIVAIQAGVGESLGMSDDEVLEQLTSEFDAEEEGMEAKPYSEDGYIGTEYTFENRPLDFFQDSGEGSDIGITRDGDNFVIDGTWDTEDESGEVDPSTLGATFTFAVTFPGKVSDHNGELSDDGHTVTWNLLDAPDTLHAVGGATTGGSSLGWIVIVAGVLIILAIVAVVVVRSRSSKAAAVPAGAAAAEGDAPTADAPAADAPAADAAPEAPESKPEEGTPAS